MMNAMKGFVLALAVMVVLVGTPGQSLAALTVFSSRSAFESTITAEQTITFEAQNTGPPFTYYGATGLTTNGVQFTAPLSNYLYVADVNAVTPAYNWGSGASLLFGSTNEGGNLVITLPSNTFNIGLDFMCESDTNATTGQPNPFTFTVNGGTTFTGTSLVRPNRAFFGVTSDTAISTLTITMTNLATARALPIIDNVSFGVPLVTVPEPSSLALVGIASLMGLGSIWQRRRGHAIAA